MAPQTAEELKALRGCILPENSVWQPYESPKLEAKMIEKFSMKSFLQEWKRDEHPSQVSVHRGLYKNYARIPENSVAAVTAALNSGFSIVKIDIALTNDNQPILTHDRNTLRTTMIPVKKWSELSLADVEGAPIIIRDVVGDRFADTFVVTDQQVTRLEDCLDAGLAINPHATFSLDCRDDAAARMFVWLYQHPKYLENVLLQFYHYAYKSGKVLLEEILALKPDIDITLIPLIPVVFPELLHDHAMERRYASSQEIAQDAGTLYLAGLAWIKSIVDEGFRVPGISLIMAGPGETYDTVNKRCTDRFGRPVSDSALPAYALDSALLLLCHRLRRLYPGKFLAGICRSYDVQVGRRKFKYSFNSGIPIPWPEDQTKDLFVAQATPGQNNHRLDLHISDRAFDSAATLEAEENGERIVFDEEFLPNNTKSSGR